MLKIKFTNLSVPQAKVRLEDQKATVGGTCAVGENGIPIGNCVNYDQLDSYYREDDLFKKQWDRRLIFRSWEARSRLIIITLWLHSFINSSKTKIKKAGTETKKKNHYFVENHRDR